MTRFSYDERPDAAQIRQTLALLTSRLSTQSNHQQQKGAHPRGLIHPPSQPALLKKHSKVLKHKPSSQAQQQPKDFSSNPFVIVGKAIKQSPSSQTNNSGGNGTNISRKPPTIANTSLSRK